MEMLKRTTTGRVAEVDRRALVAALRLTRRIFRTDAFSPYLQFEEQPGDDVRSDDEWLDYARSSASTTYHPIGTCRMGPAADPLAVVDHQLKVHGVEQLRVVDASVMPQVPSGNTNASTLMVAEKASDMILGKQPLPPINV